MQLSTPQGAALWLQAGGVERLQRETDRRREADAPPASVNLHRTGGVTLAAD